MNPDSSERLAIALRYLPDTDDAPVVLVAGRGEIAREILRLAAEYRIPVRTDPILPSLLIRIPEGHPIPPELYRSVALLLAYLYRYPGQPEPFFRPEGKA
ncbi:MAG: EscU/YscU/HrcU family type III secretion system export apparatus switch protein [Leptospirales bacterium]